MKHERVEVAHVNLDQLSHSILKHLQDRGMEARLEEDRPNYKLVRGFQRGVVRTAIGAVRDVEVDLTGSEERLDVTLRTGAWGRDVAIPALEGFILLGGIGAAGGAGLGILMAHEFERHFWVWLEEEVRSLTAGLGKVGERYSPPMVPERALPRTPT
ncbi:MAG: hypothetical protein M1144_06415 [Candidatus Thermoplasmatota archaeon]|jgi:hypothetical protein|nr:hypothetical protein [Candidatus Thermoplasmatota archaeon]MCL5984120.1 hypothetical protein [Candidatus Thermoplasmatota archaeon]